MFSGLITALGDVRALTRRGSGAVLKVRCSLPGEVLAAGESVAVQGACLTVVAPDREGFSADVSHETLTRTTLGTLRVGGKVNLERSLRLDDRIGGHLVLGHVDATTTVVVFREAEGFAAVRLALPRGLAPEVAEKGSVSVDGVSLTVSAVGGGWFETVLVPTTLASTTLGALRAGDRVNVETDILAKYVRRALGGERRGITSLLADSFDAQD